MNIIKEIKDFINSLEDGWKPFFIFVFLFQAMYSIVAVFGYLVWIIVSRRRLNKLSERNCIKSRWKKNVFMVENILAKGELL